MDASDSLDVLIAEAKRGSAAAFRTLYDELSNRLFLHVRSRTHARDDALDVLQDTFVDFWKALGDGFEYRSEPQVRGFLYTIASRKIAKLYGVRRPVVPFADVEDFLPASDGGMDAHARGEFGLVMEAIGRLDEKDREVIELRYFAGLPFGEIAELSGANESAAKVRHHRALKKLRELLDYE